MFNKMSFKAAKKDPRWISVSDGNRKLKPTKKVKYIIFNLLAIVTCPFATEHCKQSCYALKAERMYPTARASRERNTAAAMSDQFVDCMIFTINAMINRPGYKAADNIIVRIHESGDFFSKDYALKWLEIARHFSGENKVTFVAYTKSVRYFRGELIPENMVVRYSIWDDTDPDDIALAAEMGLPVYTAVEKFTTEPKRQQCDCLNCSTCLKCFKKKFDYLACEIH